MVFLSGSYSFTIIQVTTLHKSSGSGQNMVKFLLSFANCCMLIVHCCKLVSEAAVCCKHVVEATNFVEGTMVGKLESLD